MANGTTSGVTLSNFTGLDFNVILQAAMASAQIPLTDLQNQLVAENLSISTLGKIGGDFSALQSSLNTIKTSLSIPPVAATVSQNAPFSAAVTGGPMAGTYAVSVSQLAAAETVASQGYASSSSNVGTGTITITTGTGSTPITIDSTNDTVAGVAGAINSAGIGVTAQVINTGLPGAPYRLEITSNATGSADAFTVASSLAGGIAPDFGNTQIGPTAAGAMTGTSTPTVAGTYTGSLSQGYHFTVSSGGTVGTDAISIAYSSDSGASGTVTVAPGYTPGSAITVADGLTLSLSGGTLNVGDKFATAAFVPQVSAAQDALLQVGNQIVTSASNQVTNAVPGLTLALDNVGGPATVTVAPDQTAQGNQISGFVAAYNNLVNDITANTQAVPNQSAPPLANDGGLRETLFNLQFQMGTLDLSKLGITADQHSGQLSFSQSAFTAAQAADPTGVSQALGGLYSGLNPVVSDALTPNTGLIATETSSDQTQVTDLNKQIADLNKQLQQEQAQLVAEYAQIQAAVSGYQSLAQLFTGSSSSNGSSGSSTPPPGSNLTVSA